MKAMVCVYSLCTGRTDRSTFFQRQAVILRPSMDLSFLLLTSSSHPSERLNTYLTGDAVILWTFHSSLPSSYTGPVILLWWLLVYFVAPRMNQSSFFFCGRSCHPPFLSKSCHPFPWMTISALFLFTLFEGNLREPSLSAEDVTQVHTMGWLGCCISCIPTHNFWLFFVVPA